MTTINSQVPDALPVTSATMFLKRASLWIFLSMLVVACLLLSLVLGRYPVPAGHVVAMLSAHIIDVAPNWTPTESMVVHTVRLPRALIAAVAGGGLALCGAVLQGVFRLPLVDPYNIGAASGASLGGVIAILVFGLGPFVQAGAFAGAAAALLVVLTIQRPHGTSPALTLVLTGIAVSSFCTALVGFTNFIADPETQLPGMVFWLLGSFARTAWSNVSMITACTVIGGAVLLGMRWRINVLALGDDDARTLGINPRHDRLILLAAICLIVSAQVAVSGIIGWVGLVIPNMMRLLLGADHRKQLPAVVLIGACFMMIADLLARDLTPAEIPVGIITALVGTPVFALLLRQTTGIERT
jgi:iron complex transport system permease protein